MNKKLVDDSKHRYLMNTTWVEDRFTQDKYKLAYFHFLLRQGNVSPELYVPEANIQLVQDQVLENDDFLVRLNEHFVITKRYEDKVSQCVVREPFERDLKVRQINANLKRLGVTVGSCHRVYRGIRRLTQEEREDDPEEKLDNDPE